MAKDNQTRAARPTALPRLAPGTRIAIVSSSYHGDLVGQMTASAHEVLEDAGLAARDWIEVVVPGAFELPIVARRLARRADVHAVLCFGLVLRGETDHDRYISQAVATRLLDVSLETDKPVLFGVLTPNDLEQARRRARPASEGGLDKGREVAVAVVEVLAALRTADSIGVQR